ncbi:MAG: AAA family ATPase [Gemmatimonadota bacterium]
MKPGEIEQQLTATNLWWRDTNWTSRDRDLGCVATAPFVYRPDILADIQPNGLYLLLGPRRVGKSVEIKRAVEKLIARGVDPRRIFHAACDGWRDRDLYTLVRSIDSFAPPEEGPRYVFLDEITGVKGDWVARIKWLRDNTSLGDDCVALSGSSSERLEDATKALAGRRGDVPRTNRTLLPMGFRAFCAVTGVELPDVPSIHPRDMLGREAAEAIRELRVYLDDLVVAWERYLDIGGLPQAVANWIDERRIGDALLDTLWDVIHGDALAADDWTAAQTLTLLNAITLRIGSPMNVSDVARELGDVSRDTVNNRLRKLEQNYIAWSCPQNEGNRAKLNAQRKYYMLDPLYARIAPHRGVGTPPDYTRLTEQQIGVALLRAREAEEPGAIARQDTLLYYRSATRAEIDFTAGWLDGVPYEAKYTEGAWLRETQTATAAYGRCVLATRNVVERVSDSRRQLLAIPAPMLALLIDPHPGIEARRR